MSSSDTIVARVQEVIKKDDFRALGELITSGTDGVTAFFQDYYGRTLMYMAAARGSNECIKTLADAGANVNDRVPGYTNIPDTHPRTPLNRAIASGKVATAELLLSLGANPRMRDLDGRPALHHVALKACTAQVARYPKQIASYVELIDRLISEGCVVDEPDFAGYTALLNVVHVGPVPPPAVIQALLSHGANICAKADGAVQVMHRPWKASEESLIQYLASSGADLNAHDARGRTPLMHASDLESMQNLIELGADPALVDLDGRDLLHYLIANEHLPTSRGPVLLGLIATGLSARKPDFAGCTAFDLLDKSVRNRHQEAETIRMAILAYEANAALRVTVRNRSQPGC